MRFGAAVWMAVLAAAWGGPADACTNVFSAAGGVRLAASNLDCGDVFPTVWFVPPGDGTYGRFCFGTDSEYQTAEGGMNERGLYIAVNALDEGTGWAPDPELPDWESWEGWDGTGVPDGILARCATVVEAVDVFRSHNLLTLEHVKFLLADRTGASVVIEWSDGGLVVVPRPEEADHQVSTNVLTSAIVSDGAACERHRAATAILAQPVWRPDVDGMRRILSATHLEFQTPTVLSAICDLRTGGIHLYYFHDFERVRTFNLRRELDAGRHGFALGELFEPKPYVATVYERLMARGGG